MNTTHPGDSTLLPLPRAPARRPAEARRGVRRLVTRVFFGTSAAVAGLAAAAFTVLPAELPWDRRTGVVACFALLTALAAGATRLRGAWIERAMFGLLAAGVLVIAGTGLLLGWGLATPALGFYGLFVCVLCAAANRRMGIALAGISVLALFGVAAGTEAPPAGAPAHDSGDLMRLLTHLAGVAAGLAGGLFVSWVVTRYVRSADDREQRFRGLLGIAADAYWELDERWRIVAVIAPRSEERSAELADAIDGVPWELPQFGCDAETLDALLADLESRQPFRDLTVHWDDGQRVLTLRVSGEPRFDEAGAFCGYWGVARDVSAELAARSALAETEWRWNELFNRIPTPLVVHRDGRIVDANPAACALFAPEVATLGAARPRSPAGVLHGELVGRDLLALYEDGDSRERERRRIDELAAAETGTALPVADFRIVARDGRRLEVRSAAVRLESEGEPVTMTIYVDDTERRAAEAALRRSETMLAHIVATSPDIVALVDLGTERFAMVNRAFERATGWPAAQAAGRTGAELGLWRDPASRERLFGELRGGGSVQELPMQVAARDGRALALRVSGARFAFDRRDYGVINARDVTDSERLRLEREAILEQASIGIAVTRGGAILLANPRIEEMLGWPRGSLAGQPTRAVVADDTTLSASVAELQPRLAQGHPVETERSLARRDGSLRLCRLLARPVDPHGGADGAVIWIIEDITERRAAERTLAAARDAAEAASRAKSAFLANTSHELRTPLNGLVNLARLAREPALEPERRDAYLGQILTSAEGLAGIFSDMLDLARMETGRLELQSAAFDLGELLRALGHSYATLASARGLALDVELGAGVDRPVRGDPLRLRQILGNYLGNALKFTPSGRVRLVALRRPAAEDDVGVAAGGFVRFEVHDSGPGIDAATQARLFRPFTQADESSTRRHGGTGLGLSICRELALAMGGRVGVASEPGLGSCFWAELPLPLAPEQPPAPPRAPLPALRGRRVLVVEDNPVNMLVAVALLERWGMVVEQSTDGQQAIAAAQRAAEAGQPFDAVLMDVQMPVMSGHEAAMAMRAQPWGQRLPIIALTAAALVSERERALEAGMDDFLTKPVDAEQLCESLARWAGSGRGLA